MFVLIAFFIGPYSEYKCDLYVSRSAFCFDNTGRKIGEKDFGFLTYIGYCIYDWMNTFGVAPDMKWPKMRDIDQAREEATAQLDVKDVFKRLQHLEKIAKLLTPEAV